MAKGWHFSPEQLQRLSESHKGKIHSIEQRKKISNSVKRGWKDNLKRKEELSKRLVLRHHKEKESNILNPLQRYIKEHPEHQSKAGKIGGNATIKKYGKQHMRNAYSILTPELRRKHKKLHDIAVEQQLEKISVDAKIVFVDLKGKTRPDIIYYKDGKIHMIDIKVKHGVLKVETEDILIL